VKAAKILRDLQLRGFAISLRNESILISPKELLTDSIRSMIRQHKSEIVLLLEDQQKRPSLTNTLKADQLLERIEALHGIFYDDEDLVFVRRWLKSGQDASELETLIIDAERQVANLKTPQTI
jgi:TubC N-terminal docking domain